MPKLHVYVATLPALLLLSASAIAADLTIKQPTISQSFCKLNIQKAYQEATGKPVHVVVENKGVTAFKGKLYAHFAQGKTSVLDGSDFDLKPGQTADLTVVHDAHGLGNTATLTFSVPVCTQK